MVLSIFRRPPAVIRRMQHTPESLALARWYDSHASVRRLLGIREERRLRVIVAVEPTNDNDDIYPVWLANAEVWAGELRSHTGSPVQLELIQEPFDGINIDAGGIVIADLFWRDATLGMSW